MKFNRKIVRMRKWKIVTKWAEGPKIFAINISPYLSSIILSQEFSTCCRPNTSLFSLLAWTRKHSELKKIRLLRSPSWGTLYPVSAPGKCTFHILRDQSKFTGYLDWVLGKNLSKKNLRPFVFSWKKSSPPCGWWPVPYHVLTGAIFFPLDEQDMWIVQETKKHAFLGFKIFDFLPDGPH